MSQPWFVDALPSLLAAVVPGGFPEASTPASSRRARRDTDAAGVFLPVGVEVGREGNHHQSGDTGPTRTRSQFACSGAATRAFGTRNQVAARWGSGQATPAQLPPPRSFASVGMNGDLVRCSFDQQAWLSPHREVIAPWMIRWQPDSRFLAPTPHSRREKHRDFLRGHRETQRSSSREKISTLIRAWANVALCLVVPKVGSPDAVTAGVDSPTLSRWRTSRPGTMLRRNGLSWTKGGAGRLSTSRRSASRRTAASMWPCISCSR